MTTTDDELEWKLVITEIKRLLKIDDGISTLRNRLKGRIISNRSESKTADEVRSRNNEIEWVISQIEELF